MIQMSEFEELSNEDMIEIDGGIAGTIIWAGIKGTAVLAGVGIGGLVIGAVASIGVYYACKKILW